MSSSDKTAGRRSSAPLRTEQLAERAVPAVLAFFNDGVLSVQGDGAANDLRVSADAAGNLGVTHNGAAVTISNLIGGPATTANTRLISLSGEGGNDTLTVATNVGTINASLSGGGGSDTLTAGRGASVIDGGSGDDLLVSGFGNDVMFGGSGNDVMRWDPGTINDVMEGGSGTDTVLVIGNDTFQGQPAGDRFVLKANGERVRFDRTNLVPFALDIGTTEIVQLRPGAGNDEVVVGDLTGAKNIRQVEVEGGDGDDKIDASGQLRRNVAVIVDGGAGNDVITGGAGNDQLFGGVGDDRITGGRGTDQLAGGAGNDTLDGGSDGSIDVLSGGGGADTFVRFFKTKTVGGQPVKMFDETLADLNAAEGDVVNEMPRV